VEAGSNTSFVSQRFVGGDEKEPSVWAYDRAALFLGDILINTGNSDLRITALARSISNYKRQIHPLVREDVMQELIKLLVVSLKGFLTKESSLVVNCAD
jgi:hypothetical protein